MAKARVFVPKALGHAAKAFSAGPGDKEPAVATTRFTGRSRKIDNKVEASAGPSYLWRLDETSTERQLDGPLMVSQDFEIECRSPDLDDDGCPESHVLADFAEAQLIAHAIDLQRFDEPDDPSQQRGHYYAHVIRVTLPVDGLPDLPDA